MTVQPTHETYAEIERAYAFFNEELFAGRLPHCLITLQRQHDTYGYFSANQFVSRNGQHAHEISLNPSYFVIRSIPETLSVLVREMVTLDQLLNSKGKPPRRRYRNKEWADMVEAIGLMPTDTGLPGGKRVGDCVQTYIIEGGPFDIACSKLVDDQFTLSWVDRFPPRELSLTSLPERVASDSESDDDEPTTLGDTLACTMAPAGPIDLDSLQDLGCVELTNAFAEDHEDDSGAGVNPDTSPTAPASTASVAAQAPSAPPMKRYDAPPIESLKEMGIEPKEAPKNLSKSKFSCSACGANSWGKPSLRIQCTGTDEKPHAAAAMALTT